MLVSENRTVSDRSSLLQEAQMWLKNFEKATILCTEEGCCSIKINKSSGRTVEGIWAYQFRDTGKVHYTHSKNNKIVSVDTDSGLLDQSGSMCKRYNCVFSFIFHSLTFHTCIAYDLRISVWLPAKQYIGGTFSSQLFYSSMLYNYNVMFEKDFMKKKLFLIVYV